MVRDAWEVDVRDEADNWTIIQDAAARKRVQNRLAQRAHRMSKLKNTLKEQVRTLSNQVNR
jgi:hypothetical protein